MHQQKSKKILIYFFLFLIMGTLNNKNFNNFNFPNIKKIEINGLSENNNSELLKKIKNIKLGNLFFVDESKITEIINSNQLIENYSVFKKYPSSLEIEIIQTEFLANIKEGNNNFFLGSNGKLIKTINVDENLPFIFGKFNNESFLDLKKDINDSKFEYDKIKNLFYLKSGRWNIETYSGLKIKLPKDDIKETLDLLVDILLKFKTKSISSIDFRQKNQIIIDE